MFRDFTFFFYKANNFNLNTKSGTDTLVTRTIRLFSLAFFFLDMNFKKPSTAQMKQTEVKNKIDITCNNNNNHENFFLLSSSRVTSNV